MILLIILACTFPLFLNLSAGAALIYEADRNYRSGMLTAADLSLFRELGIKMLISSVAMLTATVLCIKKKDISAVIFETAGIILCLSVVYVLRKNAAESGLSNDMLKPYSQIYFERHFPTILHTVVLFILSLTDFFSYEYISRRRKNNKS